MIITRSPLRISLGGGGTDLPSYYQEHNGFIIAGAIDLYVYIMVHPTFFDDLILKYSQLERVRCVNEIKHPIFREAFKLLNVEANYLEICSMADIPAGTGLGSSGSFTTALLKALHALKKNLVHSQELAEQACHIEIDLLQEPIGKQDQYIAAYGGLTCFEFFPNGEVAAKPLNVDNDTIYNMEDNLVLFYTGYSRAASTILQEQKNRSQNKDREMLNILHVVKEMGYESQQALESGDLVQFARILDRSWQYKKKRSSNMSNNQIDHWYELACKNGALGGKLVGAGGGGFLMFYAEDKIRLRKIMREAGLKEIRFRFDFEGTKVMSQA